MFLQFLKDTFSFDPNSPLLFTQLYFWVFFIVVFAFFSLMRNKILMRNAFLFFVSVFLYYKTSGWFTLILVFSTFFNYLDGFLIYKCKNNGGKRAWLVAGLLVNMMTLCYFKYAYFFADIVCQLFGVKIAVFNAFAWVGNQVAGQPAFTVDKILLPVGISFYTFQCISYLMDVFRERVEPVKNVLNFGFYLTFFPQLVAGPIVRASSFIPQLSKKYFLSRRQFGVAMFWIVNGMAKKIILSDYIAVNFVDRVFENPTMFSGFENLVALFGYSLQVYADFSGYTDIAIGVAMLMGFYLPQNFNSPYKATNPGAFWKRWHISLSQWLQDYLYVPLGGNRNATFGTYACILTISFAGMILSGSIWVAIILLTIALIVTINCYKYPEKKKNLTSNMNRLNTMLLGGLWHGASWNFMIWGGLNGIGMIVYRFWKDFSVDARLGIMLLVTMISIAIGHYFPAPVWNIAVVWTGAITIGTFIRFVYTIISGGTAPLKSVEMCWAVIQTFVFITWTRLFFRAGSNLDPAEANETAWNTAKDMVGQIGGTWNTSLIPHMVWSYRYVFSLIVIGMIIHWLPENFKRRYRIWFASSPLVVMGLLVVLAVIVIYQFITADLQTFIYFQF
ncbi:MAG: MBOAT family protein [Paludibacteraceae bacterium]|nr:MBOAT family protein [Paludibacteraceae bacterium]